MTPEAHTNRSAGIRIALLGLNSASVENIAVKAEAMGDPVISAHIKPNGCTDEWLEERMAGIKKDALRKNIQIETGVEGFVVIGSLPEVLDVLEQQHLLDGKSLYLTEGPLTGGIGGRYDIAKASAEEYGFDLDEYIGRKGTSFLNTPQKGTRGVV